MNIEAIEIHAGQPEFEYEPIRRLEAKCEAKTAFSQTPTMAQVNSKLRELAASVGADAVVGVSYDSGVSLTSWRSMKGTGLAVRKVADEMPCPRCAEKIKRAAKVCRFCGAELGMAQPAPAVGTRTAAQSTPTRRPSSPPMRPHIPAEPLKATDNSQVAIFVVLGFVVLSIIIAALST